MSETRKKDEPLTTAEFAGTTTDRNAPGYAIDSPRQDGVAPPSDRPRLVRNETRNDLRGENISSSPGGTQSEPVESDFGRETAAGVPSVSTNTPLLADIELSDLRSRWSNIQAEFVDEPQRSVEQADQLVATTMQRLAEGFARERASLEKQWDSGANVSTEDLRVALQRYRAFFGRLLNAA